MLRRVGSSVKKFPPGNNPISVAAMPSAISRTPEVLNLPPMKSKDPAVNAT